jgi:hypothetical protein
MNANLLNIVNRIVAEQGEGILADAKRLFPFFADYAKNEYKEDRVAFGRCIEMGAYQELKKTCNVDERQRMKAALTNQINAKTGVDRPRCTDALDLLEAVIFKAVSQSIPVPSQAKFCSKCGKIINKGERFCSLCGTPIATQEQTHVSLPVPQYTTQPMLQQQHTQAGNTNGYSTLLLDYKLDIGNFNEHFNYFAADGKTISTNKLFNKSTFAVVAQELLMGNQNFVLKAEIYNDKISFFRLTALGLGKPSGDKFEINGSQIASVEMKNTFWDRSITIITQSREKLKFYAPKKHIERIAQIINNMIVHN